MLCSSNISFFFNFFFGGGLLFHLEEGGGVWSFSFHSRIFHSYTDVTITGEGLQILTSARHSMNGLEQ